MNSNPFVGFSVGAWAVFLPVACVADLKWWAWMVWVPWMTFVTVLPIVCWYRNRKTTKKGSK